jgi:hypothetical protein
MGALEFALSGDLIRGYGQAMLAAMAFLYRRQHQTVRSIIISGPGKSDGCRRVEISCSEDLQPSNDAPWSGVDDA